jgi:death-on-curing protein
VPRRRESTSLTRCIIEVIHGAQIHEHGGSSGVRDGLLESALARPHRKWACAEKPDLTILAAAYTFGLAKNYGYADGNKRVAFMAGHVFVGLTGHEFDADETDVADTIEREAAGQVSEAVLAAWFRERLHPEG